ncbi:juvenile hormone esterase-like isoform X2 [Periplaneta americana]|uniref:juvenile hormone esterase-like isoform X2 n=1 Tax=Periplaneta americana TaxID=6978 RepID=UPI0037E7F57A
MENYSRVQVILMAGLICLHFVHSSNLVVVTSKGKVRGTTMVSVRSNMTFYGFMGIPYAKPPLGDLRYKAPLPPDPWDGVKDCVTEGSVCPQETFNGSYFGDEDCLFLNVYTPKIVPHDKTHLKPVMVWIHGGFFIIGSGNRDESGPDYLIDEGVVLVTINYRLGILGFLNLKTKEAPGNAGLKDQILALKWVQENIAQFGGDPNRVTIFGQSSGAVCVHLLTLSPLAKALTLFAEGIKFFIDPVQIMKALEGAIRVIVFVFLSVYTDRIVPPSVVEEVTDRYYGSSSSIFNRPANLTAEDVNVITDLYFTNGISCAAGLHAIYSPVPVYAYELSYEARHSFIKEELQSEHLPGVPHGEDLIYLFPNEEEKILEPNSTDMLTSKRILKYWTNFATTGSPTPTKDPLLQNITWQPVTKSASPYLGINVNLTIKHDLNNGSLKFWKKLFETNSKVFHGESPCTMQ